MGRSRVLACLACVGVVWVGAGRAGATTITVTNMNSSGPGSLGDAIAAARGGAGVIINFDPSLVGTITLTNTPIQLGDGIQIMGPGARQIAITAAGNADVFLVAESSLTVSGLSFIGAGRAFRVSSSNIGALGIDNCAFTGHNPQTLTNAGGAIFNGATSTTLTVTRCTFTNNTAATVGTSGGGAIFSQGPLTIVNSTFTGNTSPHGGAILASTASTIVNCTIAGNSASVDGGGVWTAAGTVALRNSIVWGNTAPSGPDCFGAITSNGYNLLGSAAGVTGVLASDMVGRDPLLGPVANNGGSTDTRKLLPGSPALDRGALDALAIVDQRGLPRPHDLPAIPPAPGGNDSDIGAYEEQAACRADFNGSGALEVQDIFDFLAAWFAGCP